MGKKRVRHKQRRSYLKRFSSEMVNTGSKANTALMQKYHGKVDSYASDYLNKIFFTTVCKPNDPRQLVLDRISEMLIESDPHRHVVLIGGKLKRLLMFYSPRVYRDKEQPPMEEVFFIENDLRCGIIRRSVNYPSRDRAMLAFNKRRINWVRLETYSTATSPPASVNISPST